MSKFSYKTVNTKTVDGLKLAEKLKSDGWILILKTPDYEILSRKE